MSSLLSTIVLVHGAWHTPPVYQTFIDALRARGFTVHCPRLPSCNGASPPTASLPEDIACVRDIVNDLVSAGQRVLMLMHSYGGAVGTDAIEDFTIDSRAAAGLPGGVIHLVYLCAYMLQQGSSVWDIVQRAGYEALWPDFVKDVDDGTCFPKDPRWMFFDQVEKDSADQALRHLVRFPLSALKTPSKGEAWRRIPTTYAFTCMDYGVPARYQDMMLRRGLEEVPGFKVGMYNTCHSIFLTMQKEMVDLVIGAAGDQRNAK